MSKAPHIPLSSVLAQVEAVVGYLRVSASAAADSGHDDWLSCATLVDTPGRLAEVVRSTMAGRGTQQESVAASLFVQSYAFRIGALVLAPYALGLPTPGCAPADTYVRLTRHRPGAVAVTDPEVHDHSVDQLVGVLLGRHLAPLITATTSAVTIGRRLLWGNVAASCAAVFRAIEGAEGVDRVAVRDRADAFFVASASWLQGLGWFETVLAEPGERRRWQRTNCCLYYQCTGAAKCDDCSLDRLSGLSSVNVEVSA